MKADFETLISVITLVTNTSIVVVLIALLESDDLKTLLDNLQSLISTKISQTEFVKTIIKKENDINLFSSLP